MLSVTLIYPTVWPQYTNVTESVLWPNGWTDQDEAWQGGRPRPWPHCVRCGSSCLAPEGAQAANFAPLLWPNDWMHQDATWYGGR